MELADEDGSRWSWRDKSEVTHRAGIGAEQSSAASATGVQVLARGLKDDELGMLVGWTMLEAARGEAPLPQEPMKFGGRL